MVILLRTPMVHLHSLVAVFLSATLYLTAPLTQVLILACLISAAFACGNANRAARARGNTGKNFINILYGSRRFLRFFYKNLGRFILSLFKLIDLINSVFNDFVTHVITSIDKYIGNFLCIYYSLYLPNHEQLTVVTDIVAHTIARKSLKIQRQRAVLMQANVAQMFNGLLLKGNYTLTLR